MALLTMFIFFLFVVVLTAFALTNNDPTVIKVPFLKEYEIPKFFLIVISSVSGAVLMFIIFFIRDTRRFIDRFQFQRTRKKEEKIQSLYSKAINAMLGGDDGIAAEALETILREDEGHTDALLRLGDVAFGKEDYNNAVSYYKRAQASGRGRLEALISLERSMQAMKRFNEALEYSDEILEIDPDNLDALYKKRDILEKMGGRWDEVVEAQKTILKYVHNEKEKEKEQLNLLGFRYEYARSSLEKGDKDRASREFRALVKQDASFVPAYLGVAEVLIDEGESEDAVDFLEKGYGETRSHIILARLEDMLINLGDPSRIIKIYKTAVSKNPSDSSLKFFLGKLYFRLEMIDDAMEVLLNLDTVEPYPERNVLLGSIYHRRNQCDKAVEELKKAVEMKVVLRLPYCCSDCGRLTEDWSGRCPDCGHWNSYMFNLHGICKV